MKYQINNASEVKNSSNTSTLAHETRKRNFSGLFLCLIAAVCLSLSACKDKDGDGDKKSDWETGNIFGKPMEELAKYGLTIKTPAGYKAGSAVISTNSGNYGNGPYTSIQVDFYGNASSAAFVKQAFTDSGWTDPKVSGSITSYSKTGYNTGDLDEFEEDKDGLMFRIYIERPK